MKVLLCYNTAGQVPPAVRADFHGSVMSDSECMAAMLRIGSCPEFARDSHPQDDFLLNRPLVQRARVILKVTGNS